MFLAEKSCLQPIPALFGDYILKPSLKLYGLECRVRCSSDTLSIQAMGHGKCNACLRVMDFELLLIGAQGSSGFPS